MLKQFLASTAIVALMAGGSIASAQSTTTDTQAQGQAQTQMQPGSAGTAEGAMNAQAENQEMMSENELLASEFIGMSVYNSTADDAEEIAGIEDVLMSQDGQVAAVVLKTGGFLGLGGNSYAIPMDRLEITQREDGEFWITSDIQQAELEGMTVFVAERPSDDSATQDMAATETEDDSLSQDMAEAGEEAERELSEAGEAVQNEAAELEGDIERESAEMDAETDAETDTNMAADANRDAMQGQADSSMATGTDTTVTGSTDARTSAGEPVNEADYATAADVEALTADNLMGVNVVGANNEDVGDVADLVLDAEGKVEAMVIDVGGFLGIGAKPVAVAYKDLDIRQNEDGDLVLFTQFTEEKLEGAAEYEEAAYQQDPEAIVVNPNE